MKIRTLKKDQPTTKGIQGLEHLLPRPNEGVVEGTYRMEGCTTAIFFFDPEEVN